MLGRRVRRRHRPGRGRRRPDRREAGPRVLPAEQAGRGRDHQADTHGRKTVMDLVPTEPRVFPVGRLDVETEGLLLITNDGDLANRIAHPSHGVDKEYLAQVEGGAVSAGQVRQLREGDRARRRRHGTRQGVATRAGRPPDRRSTRARIARSAGCATRSVIPVRRLVRTRIGPITDRSLRPGRLARVDRATSATPWSRRSPLRSPAVTEPRRANVIGLGLIGGSIALACAPRGWWVARRRRPSCRSPTAAVDRGVIDAAGLDPDATITFVAVPVLRGVDGGTAGARRDDRHRHRRRERQGPDLRGDHRPSFRRRSPDGRKRARRARRCRSEPVRRGDLGAHARRRRRRSWCSPSSRRSSPVSAPKWSALTPERHDEVVAVVSHVPHLTAASLMRLAADRSIEHAALLRLAAGGFRDMTRVASGRPDIWLDICDENRVGDRRRPRCT